MLELNLPINNKESFNNFSMEEIAPIAKINLRGKVNNKDFTSKVGKILGIILPVEVGSIAVKDEISIISMGPNEWLIISNDTIKESNND
jgi:sarcosine oxidase gamma subunit